MFARTLALLGFLLVGACSDVTTAPEQQQTIDRVAAARLMPSVTDARLRVSVGLDNAVIRQRVVHDLNELEVALANGDGQKARFHVRVVSTVLTDYRSQQGAATTDGAEVSAVMLALKAVSQVINAGIEL